MKKYLYEDLRAMSQLSREIWLAEQCTAFESELQVIFPEKEKETFTEELYKKLRQITRRWASWNHKTYGAVVSRGHVQELMSWEHQIKSRGILPPIRNPSQSPDINYLQRLEELSQKLEDLHQQFTKGIYEPLFDFFYDQKETTKLGTIPKELETLLCQWNTLLTTSAIDPKMFSESSADYIYPFPIRNRSHEHDLALRLVPDVIEKAYECLRLARRWRLIQKSSGFHRDETYIVSARIGRRFRTRKEKTGQRVTTLENELQESQQHYEIVKEELEISNTKCSEIEDELKASRQQCNQIENELESVKKKCDDLMSRLEQAKSQNKSTTEQLGSSQEYCQMLQQELNSAKIRYCAQKIKFINAKKRCSTLASQLQTTQDRMNSLEGELDNTKRRCHDLKQQLDNAKKNVHTQGNMLDVLQEQCYSLKGELDTTKTKCTELSSELDKSQEQCRRLETELASAKEQCRALQGELRRSKTREEILLRQNEHLREICKAKGIDDSMLKTPEEVKKVLSI